MTCETKEREILDQVVAAQHGHYGERMGRFAPEVGIASSDVREGNAEFGITSLDVREGNTELGIASSDVREGNAELGITSLDVRGGNTELGITSLDVQRGNTELGITSLDVRGGNAELGIASLGIFIQSSKAEWSKRDTSTALPKLKCTILSTRTSAHFSIN